MPAIKRITRAAILEAALTLFRAEGMGAVNTARLTDALACSTQPLYHAFHNMDELRTAVRDEMVRLYEHYLQEETARGVYPPYKAQGMGYIRFASEEKQAFRYLFLTKETGLRDEDAYAQLVGIAGQAAGGVPDAGNFHLKMWLFVHGIACMQATGYLPFDEETVSRLLSETFVALKKEAAEERNKP